ncbi:EamA family transporter [Peptoanaerobacter stomatis]
MLNIILLLLMTLIGAIAGFFLKKSSTSDNFYDLLKNKYFYIGGSLYFISSLLNIYLLKENAYIFVITFTSITYIWSLLLAYKLLNEKITPYKIIGILLIGFGVFIISLSMR